MVRGDSGSSSGESDISNAKQRKQKPQKIPLGAASGRAPISRGRGRRSQLSAGSNDATTCTSAISGGVSSDGSHTSDISNKDTPSGHSTSETSGLKPGQSGVSESGISDLAAKTDGLTGASLGISKMTAGPTSELSGGTSQDVRTAEERNQNDELADYYKKYFETDKNTGYPKIPDYEKLDAFKTDQGILPILADREKILETLDTCQVLVIRGQTGSGKTTCVPQFILDHYASQMKKCKIWVTQPRKIAARTVSMRVAERDVHWEKGVRSGYETRDGEEVNTENIPTFPSIVGYHVGLDKCTHPDSRIIYMTPGVVTRSFQMNRQLSDVTHLIIDEVHERDIETELLLLLIKHLLKSNKDIKIILMSATIEMEDYEKFFSTDYQTDQTPKKLVVDGRTFPIEVKYINHIEEELQTTFTDFNPTKAEPCFDGSQINIIKKIISHHDTQEKENDTKSSILIFLPGLHEINKTHQALKGLEKRSDQSYLIFMVHSTLTTHKNNRELKRLLAPPPSKSRKIILSTIICESSITVPDIKIVIDLCLTKNQNKCTTTNLTKLTLSWASHENCDQRKGRAGRVQAGTCYRLLPESFYLHSIPENIPPEISRCKLETTILAGKSIFPELDPKKFLHMAMKVPPDTDVELAVKSLKQLGALSLTRKLDKDEKLERIQVGNNIELDEDDRWDGEITQLGRLMTALPIDLKSSRMIFIGSFLGLAEEAIVMAACSENGGIWLENNHRDKYQMEEDALGAIQGMQNITYWARGTESDQIAALHAFLAWLQRMPKRYQEDETIREINWRRLTGRKEDKNFYYMEQERKWCQKMGLNLIRLHEAHKLCDDISRRLNNLGYHAPTAEKNDKTDEMNWLTGVNNQVKNGFRRNFDQSYYIMMKFMIGGACITDLFKLAERPYANEDLVQANKYFNPMNTVYLRGLPRDEGYRFGEDIRAKMSKCGKVSRLYFQDEVCFVEFDIMHDLANVYKLKERKYEFPTVQRLLNTSNLVTPAVKFAIRAGKKQIHSAGSMEFSISNTFAPTKDTSGPYFINFNQFNFQTKFPKRKITQSVYQIVLTDIISPVMFYAVRESDEELLEKMDEIIDAHCKKNGEAFKGEISVGSMVFAPFEYTVKDTKEYMYHRAVVLSPFHESDAESHVVIQYCDYGSIRRIETSRLFAVPDDLTVGESKIIQIPLLAVKYRLRGITASTAIFDDEKTMKQNQEIMDELPFRYAVEFYKCESGVYAKRWISVFSTFEGTCVAVDSFETNPGNIGFRKDANNLIEASDNFKLLQKEDGYIIRSEESFGHVRSYHLWNNRKLDGGTTTQTSENETGGDSGRDTKESPSSESPYSYEATTDTEWVELKDTSTDSGHTSGQSSYSLGGSKKLSGPYNASCVNLVSVGQSGMLRMISTSQNSVNSVICTENFGRNKHRLVAGNFVEINGPDVIQPQFTTVLPDINGILPLIQLIFAPTVKIEAWKNKADKEESYRRMTAGLGYFKRKSKDQEGAIETFPIYEAHEARFDLHCKISESDISECEKIRRMFPQTLDEFVKQRQSPNAAISNSKQLWFRILKLFGKKRPLL